MSNPDWRDDDIEEIKRTLKEIRDCIEVTNLLKCIEIGAAYPQYRDQLGKIMKDDVNYKTAAGRW